MIKRNYRIADRIVEINSIYDGVHAYCADYQTDQKADYSVIISQEDIDFEREKLTHKDEIEGLPIRQFSDSYL